MDCVHPVMLQKEFAPLDRHLVCCEPKVWAYLWTQTLLCVIEHAKQILVGQRTAIKQEAVPRAEVPEQPQKSDLTEDHAAILRMPCHQLAAPPLGEVAVELQNWDRHLLRLDVPKESCRVLPVHHREPAAFLELLLE